MLYRSDCRHDVMGLSGLRLRLAKTAPLEGGRDARHIIPPGWGIAYHEDRLWKNTVVCYPVPLNFIVRWARALYRVFRNQFRGVGKSGIPRGLGPRKPPFKSEHPDQTSW